MVLILNSFTVSGGDKGSNPRFDGHELFITFLDGVKKLILYRKKAYESLLRFVRVKTIDFFVFGILGSKVDFVF